jgi:hypothetical protein
VNISTRACAIGRVECIDATSQCPDFCTGFVGNRRIACVNQQCTQVSASGGSSATGGKSSAGGNSAATGGRVATGGSIATGGNATTGGSISSGGTSAISTGIYDPCAGKSCGDTCTLCAPGDSNCSEAAILKSCDLNGNCVPAPVSCLIPNPYSACLDVADPDDFIIITKSIAHGVCVTLWLDYLNYLGSTNNLGLTVPKGWHMYFAASWPSSTAACSVATTAAPASASQATSVTGSVAFNGSPFTKAGFTVDIDAAFTFPQGDAGTSDSETLQATAIPASSACVQSLP